MVQARSLRAAAIQMVSTRDPVENLDHARALLERAKAGGAQIVLLPENFLTYGQRGLPTPAVQEAFVKQMADIAARLSMWIVAGSYPLGAALVRRLGARVDHSAKPFATTLVFDDSGQCRACYPKIHLFDVDVNDNTGRYRESDDYANGSQVVSCDSPWGKLGFSICYDLRFPELYVELAKRHCQVIFVPSAFTEKTGRAHWSALLRARAIETQAYVVAADQGGEHPGGRRTWGETMIVNPWGELLSKLGEGEGLIIEDLDLAFLGDLRRRMPIAHHRRL